VLQEIRSLSAYKQVVKELLEGQHLSGLGLPRAARLPVAAALHQDIQRPVLIITNRTDNALTLMDELRFWSPETKVFQFPEPTPLFYEQAAWGSVTRRERLQVLSLLSSYHIPGVPKPEKAPVVIVPIRALMARTLPRRDFLKVTRIIRVGQTIRPEDLQRSWYEIGYQAVETVLEAGQFSRRGGLLDIWPPAEPNPVRLDFFGDEIDTMRSFDPATQRKLQNLEKLVVTPAREVLPGRAVGLNLPVQEVDEFYLPLVHPAIASMLDYLPPETLVLVDDWNGVDVTATDVEEQSVKFRQDCIQEKVLAEDFPIPYLSWSEVQDSLSGHFWLELGRGTSEESAPLSAAFQPGPRFGGQLKSVLDYLLDCSLKNEPVWIISRQISRLKELWRERTGSINLDRSPEFFEGSLSDGWILKSEAGTHSHLMTDSEIFGWERPRPRQAYKPSAEAPESSYADLKPGDWVVHVDFGIGQFEGLVRRTLDGNEREFLCVSYDGGDQLFVPIHQADRLSRYIGPEGEAPHPTRLGTAEWSNAKQKVREAVLEVARDLLELYAKRQTAKGHAFNGDTIWQQELEASFPYVETQDQLRALNETKKDMESTRPMDRLLCGDVGYGKTEVALRAAFKAVMDGKQVVLLVPTTVLAQQHYETFRQRLAAFPVEVEMLSRFRTAKEQDEILKRLGQGKIDILIGTHRLVQPDVNFKDLGLVIIDEEQRFGVTHKEHFKKLRTEVDVLTLTATPIPRTLYMALTGARDISTINTPPEERLPVTTHVGPFSPRLIRQAILRELERGGQVFFVHNRVQSIRGIEHYLNKLVPEARVGIAHGQMSENVLSDVMQKFSKGDLDILLCTSIIESGLDIPNANTLIVDRGDTFGLAQLYQLRGRVGRSAQRAYAYFFRHKKKSPTPEGLERLEVIAENTQLGAGYSIAMRDLEMRGAGELLGTRQHGYIASVGFHLYTRLLAQAVRELRKIQGLPQPEEDRQVLTVKELHQPVAVDLPLAVGVPMEYVPDQNMRLRLYRRLADTQKEEDILQMEQEFVDRFGSMPEATCNLFYQIRVKILAEQAGLTSVSQEGEQIVLRYPPLPEGIASRNLIPIGFQTRVGKNAYWMPTGQDREDWQERLLNILERLAFDNARR
jgi:transcription-repair coupling factor (superfamily II helicase)